MQCAKQFGRTYIYNIEFFKSKHIRERDVKRIRGKEREGERVREVK